AQGVAFLTSVQAHTNGVYVGGYASEGLEDLLKDRPAFIKQYPLLKAIEYNNQQVAAGKKDPIAGRPHFGRYGAPCLLRFNKDLALECGTYLEGWQQVWDKKRVRKFTKELEGGWVEYFWQPTSIGLLTAGDVLVCHDGGYFRLPSEKDKELAGPDDKATEKDKSVAERLLFYDVCDYVSRLSPDLSKRVWRKDVYTPATNPEVAKRVRNGWPLPHYSNPRTQRMRTSRTGRLTCGSSTPRPANRPGRSTIGIRCPATMPA
ncbi:MAG: hypothetical protein NTW87_34560, partial [Planctomycetota bacterium]|nr:hypothetical protein [Planctomycetota bacterium]